MAIYVKDQAIDFSTIDQKTWIMIFAGIVLLYFLMSSGGSTAATRSRSVTLSTRGSGQDIL